MDEELKFPDTHLVEIKSSYDERKAHGVIEFIGSFETIDERRALFGLARRTICRQENTDLDSLVAIAQAGIADCMRAADTAKSAGDADAAYKLKDAANIFSYNLSADMAECWPQDSIPRTVRHFEIGLSASEDCLRWRHELNKGPWPFSIAWWAKGAHELSLGRPFEAVESFRKEKRYAELVLAEKDEKLDPNSDFGCVIADGYLGLALTAAGDPTGIGIFQHACDAFTALIPTGGDVGDDAKFGLEQVQTMRERITARGIIP